MATPTQRTLKHLRDAGYTCAVTEKWNPHAKIRQDLFGFIDIVAIYPKLLADEGRIIGVQATSGSNLSARVKKIRSLPESKMWLDAGGLILVYGWRKKKVKGKKIEHWVPKVIRLGHSLDWEVES